MKNVVFMINSLGRGGAEKAIIQILDSLDKGKYKLKLIVFKNDGGYIKDIPKEVNVISLFTDRGTFFSRVRWAFFWRIIRYFPMIIKKMIENRSEITKDDILVPFLEGPCTKIASMFSNKKITWMHTDYLLNRWPDFYFKSKAEELDCYNKFNRIIFVSKNGKNAFNNFFDNKIIVPERIIYNPIDSAGILNESIEKNDDIKEWLRRTDETIRIISVGRLVDVKRLDWLIKAQQQFNKENIKVSTTIVGEGKLFEEFSTLITSENINNINLLGFKKNPFNYLKNSDIYTSTSVTESYPLSIAEAFVLDLPVIATKNSGSSELSFDGKYALLVESNYQNFFKFLKSMVLDLDLRKQYIEKSIEAKKQFKLESVIRKIENLLDEVENDDEAKK